MNQIALHIPTYGEACALQDLNQRPLSGYSSVELVELVKDRSRYSQPAAVILLHDHYKKAQLPRYFSEAEIQRYFSQLPNQT